MVYYCGFKHQIQPEHGDEQADAGRDARTRLARLDSQARTGEDDHEEQDWQPYPVDPYPATICNYHTYVHIWCSKKNLNASKPSEHPPAFFYLFLFIYFILCLTSI